MVRNLLTIVAIVFFITACANSCVKPVPAREFFKDETATQRLMREMQDMADFAALQAEKAYERMSDTEKMEAVVYE